MCYSVVQTFAADTEPRIRKYDFTGRKADRYKHGDFRWARKFYGDDKPDKLWIEVAAWTQPDRGQDRGLKQVFTPRDLRAAVAYAKQLIVDGTAIMTTVTGWIVVPHTFERHIAQDFGTFERGAQENPTMDEFTRSYLETALWSSTDDEGAPLDSHFTYYDFAPAAIARMEQDCQSFQRENAADLADLDAEAAGHDFWLTRNRHGAGFWDRGLGAVGKRLTDAAHAYGEVNLYVGDDGKVHSDQEHLNPPSRRESRRYWRGRMLGSRAAATRSARCWNCGGPGSGSGDSLCRHCQRERDACNAFDGDDTEVNERELLRDLARENPCHQRRRRNPGGDAASAYARFHDVEPDRVMKRACPDVGPLVELGRGVDIGYGIMDRRSNKEGWYVHDFGAQVKVFRPARKGEKASHQYKGFPSALMVLGYNLGFTWHDGKRKHEVKGSKKKYLATTPNRRTLVVVGPRGVEFVLEGGAMYVEDWIRN